MDPDETAERQALKESTFRDWKARRLATLGFNEVEARQLAEWEVDTHEAMRLLSCGCPPSTAVRILQPLR